MGREWERLSRVELGYLEHDIEDGIARMRVAYIEGQVVTAKRYAREVVQDVARYVSNRGRRGARPDKKVAWARSQARIAKNTIRIITERR